MGRAKGICNGAASSQVGELDLEQLLQRLKDIACVHTLDRSVLAAVLPEVLVAMDGCEKIFVTAEGPAATKEEHSLGRCRVGPLQACSLAVLLFEANQQKAGNTNLPCVAGSP